MPGARRTRSRACRVENTRVSHHGCAGKHPAFPHAMVLTVSFVLSPEIGLSCHRRRQRLSCQLDAGVEASGPHDFSVRKLSALVRSAARVHRIPPRVCDDGQRPSSGTGRRDMKVICAFGKPEYFFRRDWTGRNSLNGLEKFDFTRKLSFRDAPLSTGPESITTTRGYGFRARAMRAPE